MRYDYICRTSCFPIGFLFFVSFLLTSFPRIRHSSLPSFIFFIHKYRVLSESTIEASPHNFWLSSLAVNSASLGFCEVSQYFGGNMECWSIYHMPTHEAHLSRINISYSQLLCYSNINLLKRQLYWDQRSPKIKQDLHNSICFLIRITQWQFSPNNLVKFHS